MKAAPSGSFFVDESAEGVRFEGQEVIASRFLTRLAFACKRCWT